MVCSVRYPHGGAVRPDAGGVVVARRTQGVEVFGAVAGLVGHVVGVDLVVRRVRHPDGGRVRPHAPSGGVAGRLQPVEIFACLPAVGCGHSPIDGHPIGAGGGGVLGGDRDSDRVPPRAQAHLVTAGGGVRVVRFDDDRSVGVVPARRDRGGGYRGSHAQLVVERFRVEPDDVLRADRQGAQRGVRGEVLPSKIPTAFGVAFGVSAPKVGVSSADSLSGRLVSHRERLSSHGGRLVGLHAHGRLRAPRAGAVVVARPHHHLVAVARRESGDRVRGGVPAGVGVAALGLIHAAI